MANSAGLQHFVNNVMAKRSGLLGRMFKAIEIGQREYGTHTFHRAFRVANYMWMGCFRCWAVMRPIGSRFLTNGNGPINYGGLYVYCWATAAVFARLRMKRQRESTTFNTQDGVEFWFDRYNMMFPPSFLHQRVSAHYIEINQIFFVEMLKKYVAARKEILAERDTFSQEEQKTKYITNPNYIYEGLTNDTDTIKRLRHEGLF